MPEEATQLDRGHRKERQGKVISNKMAKTIVVRVQRRFPHPQYKKVITAYSKFYAHDEKSEAKVGDVVLIQETRPLSKLKRWRLTQIVERGAEAPVPV
jgi:small subunit ribosomal protein S17